MKHAVGALDANRDFLEELQTEVDDKVPTLLYCYINVVVPCFV